MDIEEGFASIVRTCVHDVVIAAKYAKRSKAPDGIHKLRVAIRPPARAPLDLSPHSVPSRPLTAAKELHALQQELGAAREWDVLMEETIGDLPEDIRGVPGIHTLIEDAQQHRVRGHRAASVALRSIWRTQLLAGLEPLITGDSLADVPVPVARAPRVRTRTGIMPFAAVVMERRHDKARQLGKRIRPLDARQLHEWRITLKKLRYAAECFRSLWPGQPAKRYVSVLRNLRTILGPLRDASVADALLDEIARSHSSVSHPLRPGSDNGLTAKPRETWRSES